MDEAGFAGRGRYLEQHGWQNPYEIMLRHIGRVNAIAEKYGFQCHMWSDSLFHMRDVNVSDALPEHMQLVYWDYYHDTEEFYDNKFREHKALGREVWYAGAAKTHCSFAPGSRYSMKNNLAALRSVVKNGIENVLITMWGDNGGECSFFSALPVLYAARRFADGVYDEAQIKEEFFSLFGLSFDAFMALELPNIVTSAYVQKRNDNPAATLLFADPFMGIFDCEIENAGIIDYAGYEKILSEDDKIGDFGYIFDELRKLCTVLKVKYDLSVRTRKAYQVSDKAELRRIADSDYPFILDALDAFYRSFRHLWFRENKPFGFEVQDARIGGLMLRLRHCRETLIAYCDGVIHEIPELAADVLPRDSKTSDRILADAYSKMISASTL